MVQLYDLRPHLRLPLWPRHWWQAWHGYNQHWKPVGTQNSGPAPAASAHQFYCICWKQRTFVDQVTPITDRMNDSHEKTLEEFRDWINKTENRINDKSEASVDEWLSARPRWRREKKQLIRDQIRILQGVDMKNTESIVTVQKVPKPKSRLIGRNKENTRLSPLAISLYILCVQVIRVIM